MNKYWLKAIVSVVCIIILMVLFGTPRFRPDKAMLKCRGIDIPEQVSLVQTESYCQCIKNTTDIVDLNQRSKFCIERMKIHQQYAKGKLLS